MPWRLSLVLLLGCAPRYESGQVHVDALVVDARGDGPAAAVDLQIRRVDSVEAVDRFKQSPEGLVLTRTASDVRRCAERGEIAAMLAAPGARDPAELRLYHEIGVRILAPGSRDLVREMNRIGMVIDLAGASEQAFFDLLEASDDPIIVTSAAARALCPHPANLTDAQIRAVAARGGVVCVTFAADRLHDETRLRIKVLEKVRDQKPPGEEAEREHRERVRREVVPPPPDVVVDHLMHIVKIAGPEAAGFGSEFGAPLTAGRLHASASLPLLTELLLARGLKVEHVQMIMGGNVLRVIDRVVDR